jgi:predicted RNA-binding Zn-ribbon protein involved in translation (DUF1610 family)
MKTTKPDRRFKKRYILRNTILLVPPLVAFVFIWRDWGQFGFMFWPAAVCFVAWIVAWIVLDAAILRSYSCPSCGQKIEHPTIRDRKAEDPIRYYCSNCDTEWDTGLRESSE